MAEEGSRFEVAARRMQAIEDSGENGSDIHVAMDKLVAEILHAEGYGDAADIYDAGGRRYGEDDSEGR